MIMNFVHFAATNRHGARRQGEQPMLGLTWKDSGREDSRRSVYEGEKIRPTHRVNRAIILATQVPRPFG